ncbi:MAG: RagB/SusD family nutrient uptake outer membrane protein, partial [Prolixibacteraceae bacterium]|nr:RagB/SusD family nutrient uptake outer membrane protein [Prolixibacteraceae bacterium]
VLNEEGYNSNGEAFTIINQVRSRAGLSALTSAKAPNQSAFRSAIFQERRSEFACEYLRWFDVLRSGNALTIMNNFLSRADQGSGKYQMKDYQTIFAIPQDELNNNPDTKYMWQNPGY